MTQAVLDKEAFSAQVIACQETMFRTARAILRSDEDAEDAVQEAICTAFAHRDSLREAEKFKPWILRILATKSNRTFLQLKNRRLIMNFK